MVSSNSAALVWTGADGTNNTWSSGANWGGVVPGAGRAVTFGYPYLQTNANDLLSTLNSVRFNTGGFTIMGDPLTLQSGLTNAAGANVWDLDTTLGGVQTWLNSGGTLTVNGDITNAGRLLTLVANGDIQISGMISGTGGLTKNGTGRLLMQGIHTYSGVTTVAASGGTTTALQLSGPGDLDIRNSDLTMSGRMDLGNHNATIGGLNGAGLIFANDIPQPTFDIGSQ